MNDSYGDGWSNGSTVELKIDYYSLGSYSCSGYSTEVSMSIIEPPITEPTPFNYHLVVSSESDCNELSQTHWQSITIKEDLCNSKQDDLIIVNYPNLESIHVEKRSLQNLRSLVISDNPLLSNISFGDNEDYDDSVFMNVKNVTISSIIR